MEKTKKLPKGSAWQFLTKEKKRAALRELLEPTVRSNWINRIELLDLLVEAMASAI